MKKYDAIVIGSGCGAIISDEAVGHGLKVALIDRGPLIGGNCLNWGCIPSKMLIAVADRIMEIQLAKKLGVATEIKNIDFRAIMNRMRRSRRESQKQLRENIGQIGSPDFYEGKARFISDYTLEVNGKKLEGENIFIATGSRPVIPPITGLNKVEYLTNESILELKERPDSLIIIGGGYIAVEFGHFFAAMGTKVTILEMADRLILSEEPEIAELLRLKLMPRIVVHTGTLVESVEKRGKGVRVFTKDNKIGKSRAFTAQYVMVAVGRQSTADILQVEKTGVEVDERGFIKVDEHMETSKKISTPWVTSTDGRCSPIWLTARRLSLPIMSSTELIWRLTIALFPTPFIHTLRSPRWDLKRRKPGESTIFSLGKHPIMKPPRARLLWRPRALPR